MEVKKSPKADLEGRKSTWLLVGTCWQLGRNVDSDSYLYCCFDWCLIAVDRLLFMGKKTYE